MKKLTTLLLYILALSFALPALADGTSNYIYSPHGRTRLAPPAYTLERSILARDLEGVSSLLGLTDAYVTDDAVYVLSATQLLILDYDFEVLNVFPSYTDLQGNTVAFAGCTGMTVTPEGDYYIAQAESSQILHFNADHTLRRVLPRPAITGFDNVKYRPSKLVVDSANRMYVISKGMYEGIVELDPDGNFSRFYGVNNVKFTPAQLIWRVFATAEQRTRQQLWLPTDFTNVCIDNDGFIFATIQTLTDKAIKRLNSKGENILRVDSSDPYPSGDLWYNEAGNGIPTGPSVFTAVDTNSYGVFLCLDSTRSRVFAYNEDAKLLYVFGGMGDREGYFRNPVDVAFVGEKIIVLDAIAQSIELFAPTLYGEALNKAVKAQYNYDYDVAKDAWQDALNYNHNLTLAYSGIGRALLREGEYEEALEYLQQGDDRKYYTKAYEKVRNQTLRAYFVPGVATLFGLIALVIVLKTVIKRTKKRQKEMIA